MKIIQTYFVLLFFALVFLGACTPMPQSVTDVKDRAPMYPDYTDIAIPYNIAPLNFLMRNEPEATQVVVSGPKDSLVVNSRNSVCFPIKLWKNFLESNKNQELQVRITARKNGKWLRYPVFSWKVVADKLDSYLSYRLIEPGYEVWNKIQICERNIENFDERIIADNSQTDRSCMNCHIYGNKSGNLSMFHLRGKKGGTILNQNGKLRKLNLKNEKMISPAIYGDFHPSGKFGVFSTNTIIPRFHEVGNKRLEVYDTASDLVIADFENNQMIISPIVSRKNELETFPVFSPDGLWVYYCSAPLVKLPQEIKKLRYSICRIPFNVEKKEWGSKIDTVWSAQSRHGSACHLKISPNGRYLLYTVADYGTFPIWHTEADLQLMDLKTGEINTLPLVNSNKSDTYHSWSSNSHWFVFASKRDDGQYGKPYFAYVEASGKVHKAFVLPQKNPEFYDHNLKSYNIPELSKSRLVFDAQDVKQIYQNVDAELFK